VSKKAVDVEDGRVRRRQREIAKRRTNLEGGELEGGRERTGEGGRDKGTVRQLFELLLLLPPRSRIDETGCILTGDCESERERVSAVELGRGRQKREKGKGEVEKKVVDGGERRPVAAEGGRAAERENKGGRPFIFGKPLFRKIRRVPLSSPEPN